MSRWLPRKLRALPVPVSVAMGREKRIEVEISTWRFTTAVELESDIRWQRAPLLAEARDRLVRRLSQAWKVRHRGSQVATVIELQPTLADASVLISAYSPVLYGGPYMEIHSKPGPVKLKWNHRLILLQEDTVTVFTCAGRYFLWQLLATPLAKPIGEQAIREEQALARMELNLTLEDVEALKDL